VTPLKPELDDGETLENPYWIEDDSPSPEDEFEESELQEAIQHCINNLDKKFKTILVLVDVEGLDYDTASEIIGRPLGTVKSRLARARERVQECLQGFRELLPDLFRLSSEEKR
jgi:RNA polymerase sigma-70 factor (ECF subfamily)